MPNFITEDQIEQALLQRLQHVCGFDVLECYTADSVSTPFPRPEPQPAHAFFFTNP